MNTQAEIFYNYKIETVEQDGTPRVRVYNLRAKSEWKSLVYSYRFASLISREMWITNFKANISTREQYKADRVAERKAFVNPAKVGDILYSSWGYDQTNIDFYEITAVKGKQVVVREIAKSHNPTGFLSGDCMPIPGKYVGDPMTKLVQKGNSREYYLNLTSYSSAWPWDGEKKGYTQYA